MGIYKPCPAHRPAPPHIRSFFNQQVVDAGDLGCNPFNIQEAIATIEEEISKLNNDGKQVLVLGGDHTVALPILRSLQSRLVTWATNPSLVGPKTDSKLDRFLPPLCIASGKHYSKLTAITWNKGGAIFKSSRI